MTWHTIEKWKRTRFFAVYRQRGQSKELIAVCVYKKGAEALANMLNYGGLSAAA